VDDFENRVQLLFSPGQPTAIKRERGQRVNRIVVTKVFAIAAFDTPDGADNRGWYTVIVLRACSNTGITCQLVAPSAYARGGDENVQIRPDATAELRLAAVQLQYARHQLDPGKRPGDGCR